MQPQFRLYADDQDITAAIHDRLIDLTVTDEAGTQSDALKLTLDDRVHIGGAVMALPKTGTTLRVSLGYAETQRVSMGQFKVDEVEISSPPATLAVSAKAADMTGPFRSPKTRSWDNTTLGKLAETIASENSYAAKVDPALGNIAIPHLDQTEESDMALLTRLAKQYDALAKPANGLLVLAKQGAAKSVSGLSLPIITLNVTDLVDWRYHYSARKRGGGAADDSDTSPPTGGTKAYWWDTDKGERREVTTGSEPYEEIRYVHNTEQEARAAAATRKNAGERGQGELSFSLPGDPRLMAEGRLSLRVRAGLPSSWRIKRVEHRLSAQGYTTQVDCERFEDNLESVTELIDTVKNWMT